MKRKIVFITDCIDVAYNELRGVVFSKLNELNSNLEIEVEPVVPVIPFSIINTNFILRLMAEDYPEGTIFSVIVNPMQERPARLIGKTKIKNFYFLGANTGAFDWFLKDFGIEELYEMQDLGFLPFGGKYVHAPVAARIASGESLDSIGSKFNVNDLVSLNISQGTIVHIDNFGLIKFTGTLSEINEGDVVTIETNQKVFKVTYTKRMMSKETGEWIIYPGSTLGLLEIGKVRENGALEINSKVGDILKIKSIDKNPLQ